MSPSVPLEIHFGMSLEKPQLTYTNDAKLKLPEEGYGFHLVAGVRCVESPSAPFHD
jgi:hypothetical protein